MPEVISFDISEEAITMAKKNAKINDVEVIFENLIFFEENLKREYDVIVSNPPYVRELRKRKCIEM